MGELINLVPDCSAPNAAGVKKNLYVVCSCDVDVFPDRKAAGSPGEAVTLDGDIVLKANKAFKTFPIISGSGKVDTNILGGIGSKGFENGLELKVKGFGPAEVEWLEGMVAADECMICLVPDNNGNIYCIGTLDNPSYIDTGGGTTGDEVDSERNMNLVIKSKSGRSVSFYEGAIDLDETT
jgi:hypothetical protein